MNVAYYEKWFRPKKRFLRPLSVTAALTRHIAQKEFVMHAEGDGYNVVVDICSGWVSVHFLDQEARAVLSVDLKQIDKSTLFLSRSIDISYMPDSDEIEHSCIEAYDLRGSVHSDCRSLGNDPILRDGVFPPESHMVPALNFGEIGAAWMKTVESLGKVRWISGTTHH